MLILGVACFLSFFTFRHDTQCIRMCKVGTADGHPAIRLKRPTLYKWSEAKRYKSPSIAFMTDFFFSLSFLTTLEGFAIGVGAEFGGKSKYWMEAP